MKLSDLTVMDLATEPRTSLGDNVPYFFYRYVTLFAVADSMGARAKKALEDAGRKVGEQLVKGMFYRTVDDLAGHYRQYGMGLITLEDQGEFTWSIRLSECITCHGLPNVEMPLCWFDAGIIAGALQAMTSGAPPLQAREVECCGLGDASCRFEVGPRVEEEEEEA